jgi:asparagine synthase (glutamine-hydrolysing)
MTTVIEHRGPDDEGIFISQDGHVGLGARRLSIVDVAGGHQPLANEDDTIWITYNGEIYNHSELRAELQQKNHQYRTKADTETIVHLYEDKGIACLEALRGMFAFAIWDSQKQQLFLARDRVGVKPLYYAIVDGQFIFGSEIKSILQHKRISREINVEALYHYLTFVTTPAPMTLFKGIYKLPPGHYLLVKADGQVICQQYWDAIVPAEQTVHPEAYYIERIRELLRESVKYRMMSDVPFGVLLSGGIDSSLNVALMAELMDRPVDTFSVGFKSEPKYNELNYARQVAQEFGANHHEVMIDWPDLVDYMPKLIYHQDEPIADPVCVPLYYVSKLVKDSGVTVVQVGEGSDELFCGYEHYYQTLNRYRSYWRYLEMVPTPAWRLANTFLKPVFQKSKRRYRQEYLRRLAEDESLFWGGAIAFTEAQKEDLLSLTYRSGLSNGRVISSYPQIDSHLSKMRREKPRASFLEQMIYLELKIRLPELLLMRVDKISMSTSVEARVPFLDHKLVEFAMNIPTEIKIKTQPKHILKKAAEGIIPHDIIYRRKQGFGAPVSEWFRDPEKLGNSLKEVVQCGAIWKQGFFDQNYINKMVQEHTRQEKDYGFLLWNLYNLSLWYDYWIEG